MTIVERRRDMRQSTKKLICIVSVISIFVAMTIGIMIYKLTKEETPKLGIEIQSSLTINKGETERIGYNLYMEEAMLEATSSDNSKLLIKEIKDKNIVVTARENGDVTITVKATYKGEREEKKIAVKITEEVNTNDRVKYEILLEQQKNFELKDDTLYIQNKDKETSFVIVTESVGNPLPKGSKTTVTFDKDIQITKKENNVRMYVTEDCVMTITIELTQSNYKQTKEYIIKVE
ncbi:MAG: hypothetical protein K2K31_01255 [Clostridia bacterium]|nr:hypothetical protein [Clostridia bacterium]